ncbi:Response regulator receiver domain-containing protein [Geoalkalibacter ferrihydriticus]|uniref:Response regulator receiver domain-containing protein n=1 Tax=Geoalkalibacter ferrihydriticus TaxID=392333 RepID=A0A1G9JNC4_9BACT|nr:response regulator [Geoalkalibacter ferrihydriticus]SDL38503.1 Response regulator receiver domain-containing protein [Geoalkalibacter ferrihydriticus]
MQAKILCVEDDPGILTLQVKVLQRLGYETLVARNGLEAYELILRERPDAVVLDVMLPGCDGFTLTDKIRRNETVKSTPVAFVSAKSDLGDFRQGFRCGAQIYLAKPFTSTALQTAVESLLQQAKTRPPVTGKKSAAPQRKKRFKF